ncbi:hypothetical protein TNCV_3446041 [Trichonephila clavipes]|nr:hypothetical protein TNCV_3446041 [Trichonephila clavipes]
MNPICQLWNVQADVGAAMVWGVCNWRDMGSLIRLGMTLTGDSFEHRRQNDLGRFHPNLEGEHPGVVRNLPPLFPFHQLHERTCSSSPGFERSPNGSAVSVANHYTRWADNFFSSKLRGVGNLYTDIAKLTVYKMYLFSKPVLCHA